MEIDSKIISKLTMRKIVEKIIIPDFKKEQHRKVNNIKLDRTISKFKRYCDSEYALRTDEEMIEIFRSSIA